MKVILLQDIKSLGKKGEIVELRKKRPSEEKPRGRSDREELK